MLEGACPGQVVVETSATEMVSLGASRKPSEVGKVWL